MFENILYQDVCKNLQNDIISESLPGSLLFVGQEFSGKLSCALETARVVSCKENEKGLWQCTCDSCTFYKGLYSTNLLLAGFRDCIPEIKASKQTFLSALKEDAPFLLSTRYLFLRSVRKLTIRFNPIAWQNDDKLSKFANLTSEIDELLESLENVNENIDFDKIEKTCDALLENCTKLSSNFLYNTIPIQHIRNIASWAHITSPDGKKTVILESADQMNENARNALLKILEEPPESTLFILLAKERSAIMQTILSRVRTYSFRKRSLKEEKEVINRIFHNSLFDGFISDYMEQFLPVDISTVKKEAANFFADIAMGKIPNISFIIKNCDSFSERSIFKIFLSSIVPKSLLKTSYGSIASSLSNKALQNAWDSVTIFNQSVQASLENLCKELSLINKTNERVFGEAI